MEEQLNRFFELFIAAMQNIDEEYLHTTYNNLHFQNVPQLRNVMFEDGILYRFGERVYCYELYHQLRNLIDIERVENPGYLPGCYLQGELKKLQILELLDHFNLEHLGERFTPDLLMHTPGNMDLNAYVIEVKVSLGLTVNEASRDIRKILRFIHAFGYRKAIFLAINTSQEEFSNLLNNDASPDAVKNVITEELASQIFIVTKRWHDEQIEYTTLNTLLFHE